MKNKLRKILRDKRSTLDPDLRILAGREIQKHFMSLIQGRTPCCIAGYWPVREEVDVRPLLCKSLSLGHTAALPVVVEAAAPLAFYDWHENTTMTKGRYDILVPDLGDSKIVRPDIVLVPLLGFDSEGYRLGYGGGYYDRTLAALRAAQDIQAIGIAYDVQKLEELPRGSYDAALDVVVTDKQVYSF